MPFKPGHAKRGGRRAGVENRATVHVRELCRKLVEDPKYLEGLRERLQAGEAGTMEPLVWQYAFGKPKDPVESTGVTINLGQMLEDIAARKLAGRPQRTPASFAVPVPVDPRGPRPKPIDGRDGIRESSDKSTAS